MHILACLDVVSGSAAGRFGDCPNTPNSTPDALIWENYMSALRVDVCGSDREVPGYTLGRPACRCSRRRGALAGVIAGELSGFC